MKIWILTSHFGSGHASAAKALEELYRQKGHTVIVSDVVQLLYPKQAKRIYTIFSRVICGHSWLYNFLNHFGRQAYRNPRTAPAIQKELDRIRPDRILTTWSGCGRKLGKLNIPVSVCITDLGVHTGWIYPRADSYMVAAEESAEQLIRLGVPSEKIEVRGIPVREDFRNLPEKTQETGNLLIMGGGLGIIPWLEELLQGLTKMSDLKITVITGKNRTLYEKLKKEYPSVQTTGFVNNIADYLYRADFLISKPGGISLFESIYAGTPYIAINPAYQHELENAGFIEKNEIGMVIRRGENACRKITELLQDRQRCRTCRKNMAQMKQKVEQNRVMWEEYDD